MHNAQWPAMSGKNTKIEEVGEKSDCGLYKYLKVHENNCLSIGLGAFEVSQQSFIHKSHQRGLD